MNRRAALILTVLSSTACNVFDESLYLRADAGSDATVSSLTLSERCSGTVPEIPRVNRDYSLDTSGLADDLRDLASCAGRELPGNDGFFRVHMEAGELWHFHVHTLDRTHNPAIYLLPSCDDRACTRGLDECGDGRDEHISIRARETRDYFVGLDSPSSGGSPYTLTVVHAACGDGEREHGESCDDRNRTSGDGCDDQCRTELGDNGVEVEPNDDFSDPNIVVVNTAPVTVQASLGGRCDFDMFGVNLPAGGSVRVTMLDINGQPCATSTPEFRMVWMLPDGTTTSGTGALAGDNHCPAISDAQTFAQRVSTAGTYYVRVSPVADLSTVTNYKLRFEVTRP